MKRFLLLARKEVKDLFYAKTALLFLVLASFIVGYGFITAVNLYGKQSLAAVDNPLYASGFEPVPGVFGPTCGGLFVLFSLFLPLVVIPLISLEKSRNTLAILVQLPFSFREILAAKITASLLFLLLVLGLLLPCLVQWRLLGGHLPGGEFLLLLSGYLLYGLFVVAVSFFSASLFASPANASIFAIFLVILSWIVDFGSKMSLSPLLSSLSGWTVTRVLKYFEQGILSFTAVMYFVLVCTLFFVLAHILLRFDLKSRGKLLLATAVFFLAAMFLVSRVTLNADLTESRRNSFPPGIARALSRLPGLEIDVYMDKGDSRFKDYRESFLNKLALVRSDVEVRMMTGDRLRKNYGLFVYKINGRTGKTYSNSEEEIFPLLFGLAGISVEDEREQAGFPGYPLVVKEKLLLVQYTYYLLIPLLAFLVFAGKNFSLMRRSEKC